MNVTIMKRFSGYTLLPMFFMIFLISCNTGNRMDIQRLLSPAALPYLKNCKMIQISSYDQTGGNKDYIIIPAGKNATIFNVEGPGMITRFWMSIDSKDPFFLRRIVVRIFWDDEARPSVEVPLGDFFGSGFKYQNHISQFMGMSNGGYFCYLPMPFEKNARIEIVNQTRLIVNNLFFQVDYQKFEGALDPEVGYLHAQWNRSIRTDYDTNYMLLKAVGKGHIVGVNLNIQSYDGSMRFLEGDEMVYVDGEKRPSIHGTGTDDFFSGGLNFRNGQYSGPLNGLTEKNDSLGRISAYRFFVLDPIPFRKNIKFTIEHGHNNSEIADYSSTVFWYQLEPHQPFPPFPPAGQRIPLRVVKPARMIEAEKLKFNLEGLKSRIMDMSEYGPDWGGNKQLLIESYNKSSFTLSVNGIKEGFKQVIIYYTKGPEYGNADVFIGNQKAGEINGYSPFILPNGKVIISDSSNLSGVKSSVDIRFVINGKDTNSNGFHVGLDGLKFQ